MRTSTSSVAPPEVVRLAVMRANLRWKVPKNPKPAANSDSFEPLTPDSEIGIAAGRAAMDRVRRNNSDWIERARKVFRQIRRANIGNTLTGEEINILVCYRIGEPPGHHNAQGAFIRMLLEEKALFHTNLYRAMVRPQAHGRRTAVYSLVATQPLPH